ncbi:hypothetical protein FA13DRAFT_1730483 [Coprinellus micaceus]|uniref:Uncharacterized protein n=1 Tax=Coprinellus micaceus TaxID=71717 RepID=A0A4Y7TIZ0_COPMI|nr:hypothetical protein FA13DRAFT_1730483 [Coprinellus micaceus]
MDGRRVELIRRKMVRMEDPDVEPRYYDRPFQFAPLKHTDDDSYLESFKDGLGDIIVSIYILSRR